jgi:hypothetical protein
VINLLLLCCCTELGDRVERWDRWFNAGQADTRLCEMLVCHAETLTEEKRQAF